MKNYEGTSAGMEKEGAVRMFERSRKGKFIYKNFVSDGDSSAYKAVIGLNNGDGPYGNIKVIKLECINHYQKRLGSRLRKLVEEAKVDTVTKTGKRVRRSLVGGKNRLTGSKIDSLTSFFGNNLRKNVGKTTAELKRALMATYYHVFTGRHELCPLSETSYCDFQRQVASGVKRENVKVKRSSLAVDLDDEGKKRVKEVYLSLTSTDLLERCLRGLTQNANESFHSKMWTRAKKSKILGLKRLQFVAKTVVLDHNFGYQKASLLKRMSPSTSGLDRSLELQQKEKIRHAKTYAKKKKVQKQSKAKDEYSPGGF